MPWAAGSHLVSAPPRFLCVYHRSKKRTPLGTSESTASTGGPCGPALRPSLREESGCQIPPAEPRCPRSATAGGSSAAPGWAPAAPVRNLISSQRVRRAKPCEGDERLRGRGGIQHGGYEALKPAVGRRLKRHAMRRDVGDRCRGRIGTFRRFLEVHAVRSRRVARSDADVLRTSCFFPSPKILSTFSPHLADDQIESLSFHDETRG